MNNKVPREKGFDMSTDHVMKQLEVIYQGNTPPAQLNWKHFKLQLQEPVVTNRQSWYSRMTFPLAGTRRLSLSLALSLCLVVVIICSSVVYAFGGLPVVLQDMFNWNPGTQALLAQQQMTTVNQVFESDGYKLTLQEGYADANQVIIGFSLTLPHPPGLNNEPGYWYLANNFENYRLTTSQGATLPLINANSFVAKKGDLVALLYNFDAATIAGKPDQQLALHLKIPVKCTDLYTCARTATFNFTLPFHAGHILIPQQAVNRNGKNLSLQKVVVAPSETRFYMHGFSLYDTIPSNFSTPTFTSKHFDLVLSNGKKTYTICTVMYNMCGAHDIPAFEAKQRSKDGYIIHTTINGIHIGITAGMGGVDAPLYMGNDHSVIGLTLPQALTNAHGSWTMTVTQTITQLTRVDDHGHPGYTPTGPYHADPSAKPWVFTVHL
ncbi:hypothetical protein KDW_61180 [Dictyobacter vulcani]|uniref:DUF4179 domain-containing protein n=1 Tax=Dictyobacter vulcani TaxID=2607529 RepID=A0A5J4L3B5_9CHLR|nr:DUF4179 domain-containing protein [Dictyobacter vulcani]GER91956.1 hypothetical protein KDW_61180 [Dictyobacter vulcani]